MNIAFVGWLTFNTVMGGIEAVGARVAKALIKKGHHICFAAGEEKYPSIEGVPNLLFTDKGQVGSSTTQEAMVCYFRLHKVEVIVCHYAYSGHFARLIARVARQIGAKLVFEIHNDPMSFRNSPRGSLYLEAKYLFRRYKNRRQWRLIGRLADRVILLSPSYIGDFCRFSNTPREKVTYIPNPNSFTPEELPDHPLEKEKIVLYLGRFDHKQKRVDRLLRVWQMIQSDHTDWSLHLVGGGTPEEETSLRQLVQSLGLKRVHFDGVQKPRKYLERAAILASTSSYEGLPLVMLEALQFGVVPIAFDSYAALRDLTDDGRVGICVPPFDLSAYAIALSSLIADDQLRGSMSAEALDRSTQYDMERIAVQWEQILQSLIDQ